MFRAFKATARVSAAAVVVQKLLEQWHRTGFADIDPKTLSTKLVSRIYMSDDGELDGRKGRMPHKVSIAALALAQGVKDYNRWSDEYGACRFAIGSILIEMENNSDNYPFTGKDRLFIELARQTYFDHEDLIPLQWDCGQADEEKQVADFEARKQDIDARLAKFRR